MNPARINRISVLILAVGVVAAITIYFTAPPEVYDEMVGTPLHTKKYLHELRVMGGESNVAMAEFIDWFENLWHGRQLAGTVAVITVAGTLMFRFVAARPDLYRAEPASEPKPPDAS